MKTRSKWLVGLTILIVPITGRSCEPILPLGRLLGGSSAVGPLMLTQSFLWLAAAVAIKCGVFAFFERRLSWRQAIAFMLLANIVSTVPGFLLAAFTAAPAIGLALPLACAMGWWIRRRVSHLPGDREAPWLNESKAAKLFVGFFALSIFLYELAGSALSARGYREYWILKFLFVTLVTCTGMIISAILEESVVAQLSRKSSGDSSFYTSVVRANYVTLIVVLLVAAMQMLPARLKAPHFIVSWVHSIAAILGLA